MTGMTGMTPPSQVPDWPLFVLVGSHGLWAADCGLPGAGLPVDLHDLDG